MCPRGTPDTFAPDPEGSAETAAGDEEALVVLSIHRVKLAVPARFVTSVAAVQEPTPLPGAPPHIPGLVASGERALPLIDLEVLLGLHERGGVIDPLFRRVLFVAAGGLEAGLVCHRSRGLIAVPRSSLGDPRTIQGERLRPFLESEVSTADGVVGVLDVPSLLEAASVS